MSLKIYRDDISRGKKNCNELDQKRLKIRKCKQKIIMKKAKNSGSEIIQVG